MDNKIRHCNILAAIGIVATASILSGCGMLGVREIDAWGLEVKFSEGLDYSVGFNQIDNVENKRGVRPLPPRFNKE